MRIEKENVEILDKLEILNRKTQKTKRMEIERKKSFPMKKYR